MKAVNKFTEAQVNASVTHSADGLFSLTCGAGRIDATLRACQALLERYDWERDDDLCALHLLLNSAGCEAIVLRDGLADTSSGSHHG